MNKTKISGSILLSELLKTGVKYFRPDSTNFWLFNDGTKMWSRFEETTNDDGSIFQDLFFLCKRGELFYNIIDDVFDQLSIG